MLLNNPQFSYVDFFRTNGIETQKWKRYHVTKIPELLAEFAEEWSCYATIQHFSSPDKIDGEYKIAPLYFDLDVTVGNGEIDLSPAIVDTQKIISFFQDLGVEEHFIRVWFSGKKGFHIVIHPECLSIARHPEISYVMRLATDYLATHLELTTYDVSVYSTRRVWRLPNTKHFDTGMYCVELYHSELSKGADHIRGLAKAPRSELYGKEEYENIPKSELAADWFAKYWDNYHDHSDVRKLSQGNIVSSEQEGLPACARDLHKCGLKKSGSRNATCLAMTTLYKNMGMPIDKATATMMAWAKNLPKCYTETEERQRVSAAVSVVRSVYEGDYYFSCDYIRSLGAGADTPVACDRDKCKFVKPEKQEHKDVIDVTLKETRRSAFIDKKLRFSGFCGAKDSTPFWIPQHGEITCTPILSRKSSICHKCDICSKVEVPDDEDERKSFVTDEIVTPFSISKTSSIMVEMTGQRTSTHGKIIKRLHHIPEKCDRCKIDVVNHVNVERVILNPVVGFENDITEDLEAYESIKSVAYVVDEEMKPNQNYTFVGQSMPHPKTSYCIQLIEEAQPKEADIDTFNMTPAIYEELKIFQGDPEEVFKKVHDDLENNVHHVWQRRAMAVGLDLIYHSALGFKFDGQWVDRGWVQGVFVGDTGQAKSKLAIGMMKHYACGDFLNCETAERTGILYSIAKIDDQWHLKWGKMVTQDRMLLILDELQKLHPEVVTELGGAREHGFVTVDRVESGRAKTRVRMAMIANPKSGRIETMNFGIEAINALFSSPKDLRRCDFGMVLSANTVPLEVMNKRVVSTVDPVYTSDRCSNLIKWVWSRRRDQINFTEAAIQETLKQATFFGEKYQCKIPLCEHGDIRFKIARMAASAAGRTFSTKDGEVIDIEPKHVLFVREYLETIYTDPALAFDRYAKIDKERNHLDENRYTIVSARLKGMIDYRNLCNVFLEEISFSLNNMADLTGSDHESMKSLFVMLRKRKLIEQNKHSKSYKTAAFTKLLKRLLDETDSEDEYFEEPAF